MCILHIYNWKGEPYWYKLYSDNAKYICKRKKIETLEKTYGLKRDYRIVLRNGQTGEFEKEVLTHTTEETCLKYIDEWNKELRLYVSPYDSYYSMEPDPAAK